MASGFFYFFLFEWVKIQIKQSISYFLKHIQMFRQSLTAARRHSIWFKEFFHFVHIYSACHYFIIWSKTWHLEFFFQLHRIFRTNFVGSVMKINHHGIAQRVIGHITVTVFQPMTDQLIQTEAIGFVWYVPNLRNPKSMKRIYFVKLLAI